MNQIVFSEIIINLNAHLFFYLVTFPEDLDLVSAIESLQPYMTHSDPAIRGKGFLSFLFKIT